jgi:hypothetical protein
MPLSNGISIDQRIAGQIVGRTPLASLQLGLSTLNSSTDGAPAAFSRSVSWASATEPLYKTIDPQAAFDRLVGAGPAWGDARRAGRKSVLDFVQGNAAGLRARLGKTDGQRLDEFTTAVRSLEMRIDAAPQPTTMCVRPASRPSLGVNPAGQQQQPSYTRDEHARIMIDLIVMALSCDVTRVVSFMLDDARSDYAYDFLTERQFTATGSTPGTTRVGGLHDLSVSGDASNGWATIDWWFASLVSELCQKMDAIPDGEGKTLLDNSVVWFGSGQRNDRVGDNTRGLPVLYAGSGGGALKADRHLDLGPSTRLANVYLTFLTHVFGVPDGIFGDAGGGVEELLA